MDPAGDLAFDVSEPEEDEAAVSAADDPGADRALALTPELTASEDAKDAEREPVSVAEDGDWFFYLIIHSLGDAPLPRGGYGCVPVPSGDHP